MNENVTEEEKILNYRDSQERQQYKDFKLGTRRTPLSNNILMLFGDLLQPQTTGFDHINLDMSFTYLDSWSLQFVKNASFLVTYFQLWGFKKALYMERNELATTLVANRSINGKSMDLFTNTVTKTQFEDTSNKNKKTGFSKMFSKKSEE